MLPCLRTSLIAICLFCVSGGLARPENGHAADSPKCPTGWDPEELKSAENNARSLSKRNEVSVQYGDHNITHYLEKRTDHKSHSFCKGIAMININSPPYDSSGTITKHVPNIKSWGYPDPDDCKSVDFGKLAVTQTSEFATEHILEFQTIKLFFDNTSAALKNKVDFKNPTGLGKNVDFCHYLQPYWDKLKPSDYLTVKNVRNTPIQILALAFPSTTQYLNEWVLLDKGVNAAKERMWGDGDIRKKNVMQKYCDSNPQKAVQNIKDVLSAWKYHVDTEIKTILTRQRNRVADTLNDIETALKGTTNSKAGLPYEPIDLKSKWNTWSAARLVDARNKAEDHMTKWTAKLEAAYATAAKKKAATEAKNTTALDLIDQIETLKEAVKNKPSWVATY